MKIAITLNTDHINSLNLSPAISVIEKLVQEGAIATNEQQLSFDINYPLEQGDPREFSEVPEIRLWFIRLDTRYPWLPYNCATIRTLLRCYSRIDCNDCGIKLC
ncbi:hypothetical protein NUACC21_15880 [Scytonema sp. NUACC21]